MRRRFILPLLLAQVSLNASGQVYQSVFGTDSTNWNIFYEIVDAGINIKNSIVGDTDINSVSYKKLYYENWFISNDHFMREDSTHSKLYLYDLSIDSEYLVMDLSHQVGDTILYNHYTYADTIVIDSIYYSEGRKHLRTNNFLYQWPISERLEYIEGVGPTCGLILTSSSISLSGILLCHSRDTESTFIFPDSTYDCNYYWMGIENLKSRLKLDLFPNPAHSEIIVELNEHSMSNAEYLIIDLSNKILLRGKLDLAKNNIGINQLAEGSYIIQVFNENKLIASKLFFKL